MQDHGCFSQMRGSSKVFRFFNLIFSFSASFGHVPEKLRSLTMHAWAPNLVPASPMSLLMCASKRCRPCGYKVVIYGVVPVGWWCVMEVYVSRALILAHSFPLTTCSSFYIFLGQFSISRDLCTSQLALAMRVFYFKNKVEGSQIFWICLGWGCQARCRLRGSIFGFALGDNRFF